MDDGSFPAPGAQFLTQCQTLIDLIRQRSAYGERPVFTFLPDGETEGPQLTYRELDRRARAIAARLQQQERFGRRALLFYSAGLEFVTAFCGCLFAGVVAVPVAAARRPRDVARLASIAADSGASVVLTTSRNLPRARELCRQAPELSRLPWQTTDDIPSELAEDWTEPGIDSGTLALLQYTSGSTGTPRGVMVTHGNVLHNSQSIQRVFGFTPESLGLTWLPHFHDMGLIGGLLQPIYAGCASIVMPPAAFLQRPYRWLRAATRYQVSTIVAPNFAYDLCARKISAEERASLRLENIQVALTGAEPVRLETLERFAEAFAPCGFRRESFRAAYGLAEATLIVSATTSEPIGATGEGSVSRALAVCGGVVPETEVMIVDPETRAPCAAGRVGEIWISGPGVAQGYWQRPEETEETFHARLAGDSDHRRFLRSGDLGFLYRGNTVVTGRLKDLIIIRGANHYAPDLEQTVDGCHPAVRSGCGAAFSVEMGSVEMGSEERLVIVYEIEPDSAVAGEEIAEAIRRGLVEAREVQAQAIVLIEPHSIFKTSSGKIQRFACRQAYLEGKLPVLFQWQRQEADEDSAQGGERSGLVWDHSRTRSPAPGARVPGAVKHDTKKNDGSTPAPVRERAEPIALIGLGCRFPGAENLEALWRLLRDGDDAIGEVPADRWDADALYHPAPGTPGKMNTRWGGFLQGIDLFDPHFFGISPREAAAMDPQQRLLLQVAWEALETAGQAPESLAGSKTGVFVGIGGFDYSHLLFSGAGHIERMNAFTGTGTAHSIAANRLSYLLDLRGPSLALDTACSSSLVAIHWACQSLRGGQCDLALAGGVNLILAPEVTVAFSHARMMAADGRCKTFDAAADGYVRSEGCGIAVLKRLSDALRDRDPILAVIRGSAVNQDGRTAGLAAPNGLAQRAVIREALTEAGVEPEELTYVEVHGTGTAIGDPIEVAAVKAVLGEARNGASPCLMGSVKANIGHLENASGMAGLAKVVACLEHGQIPEQIHLRKLNPRISLEGTRLEIPRNLQPWPEAPRRIAGVNSFGFGGTNAHLTIEEPPARAARPAALPRRPWQLFALSARTEVGLRELARRYAGHLERCDDDIADVCFTASAGRSQFAHRLATIVRDNAELRQRLANFAAGGSADGVASGYTRKKNGPRVAFAFSGGGAVTRQNLKSSPGDLVLEIGLDGSLSDAARAELAAKASLPLPPADSETDLWLAPLRALGALYVRGAAIDWNGFAAPCQPRKVLLPTYPFEKQRCWDDPASDQAAGEDAKSAATAGQPALEVVSRSDLLALDPEQQHAVVLAHLLKNMARVMGREESELDPEETLDNLGIDSLTGFELQDSLETTLGVRLSVNMLTDMPSINELANRLVALVTAPEPEAAPNGEQLPTTVAPVQDAEQHTEQAAAAEPTSLPVAAKSAIQSCH